MASIDLNHVTKRFNQKVAVNDLTLQVEPGEIYAFLGPNGAGKTTTIKMMVGLLKPEQGQVRLSGHDMSVDGQLAKAKLAYVPDQPFLYDKLTGREFLQFVGRMYSMRDEKVRSQVGRLSQRLDLGDWLDNFSESYSHGMKQRVVLTAALLHEPSVLIVDEPMVGLDPITSRSVKQLFDEVRQAGGTVFLSTHTLDTAEDLADRIGIIHHGRLIAEGTLEELKRKTGQDDRLEDVFLKLVGQK